MELIDHFKALVPITGKNNSLADAGSRLNIKELLKNPKIPAVSNTQGHVMKVCATDMHVISTTMLCTEQKWNIMCKDFASQLYHSSRRSFKSVTMSANGTLQKQQYTHGLSYDIIMVPCSLVQTILHEFYDSTGYQGTISTFQTIRNLFGGLNYCKILLLT